MRCVSRGATLARLGHERRDAPCSRGAARLPCARGASPGRDRPRALVAARARTQPAQPPHEVVRERERVALRRLARRRAFVPISSDAYGCAASAAARRAPSSASPRSAASRATPRARPRARACPGAAPGAAGSASRRVVLAEQRDRGRGARPRRPRARPPGVRSRAPSRRARRARGVAPRVDADHSAWRESHTSPSRSSSVSTALACRGVSSISPSTHSARSSAPSTSAASQRASGWRSVHRNLRCVSAFCLASAIGRSRSASSITRSWSECADASVRQRRSNAAPSSASAAPRRRSARATRALTS